jgi:hypothetical protein
VTQNNVIFHLCTRLWSSFSGRRVGENRCQGCSRFLFNLPCICVVGTAIDESLLLPQLLWKSAICVLLKLNHRKASHLIWKFETFIDTNRDSRVLARTYVTPLFFHTYNTSMPIRSITMTSPSSVVEGGDSDYERAVRTLREFHSRKEDHQIISSDVSSGRSSSTMKRLRFVPLDAIDESSEHEGQAFSEMQDLHKIKTCSSLSTLAASDGSSLESRDAAKAAPFPSSPQLNSRRKQPAEEESSSSMANASWGFYQNMDGDVVVPNKLFLNVKRKPLGSAFARPPLATKSTSSSERNPPPLPHSKLSPRPSYNPYKK